MRRVLVLLMAVLGVLGGAGLGAVLRDGAAGEAGAVDGAAARPEMNAATGANADAGAAQSAAALPVSLDRDYVKLGRQMIVPVVQRRETRALMLFELALDMPQGMAERAYAAEPRLRDAFLRVLLEMAHTGAFSEAYTDERVLTELRQKLRATARALLGDAVHDVLILDIMRQEL